MDTFNRSCGGQWKRQDENYSDSWKHFRSICRVGKGLIVDFRYLRYIYTTYVCICVSFCFHSSRGRCLPIFKLNPTNSVSIECISEHQEQQLLTMNTFELPMSWRSHAPLLHHRCPWCCQQVNKNTASHALTYPMCRLCSASLFLSYLNWPQGGAWAEVIPLSHRAEVTCFCHCHNTTIKMLSPECMPCFSQIKSKFRQWFICYSWLLQMWWIVLIYI